MAATAKVVDFSNVKDAGAFRPARVKEGDYPATITNVDDHLKEGEKVSTQWVFTIKLDGKRGTYPYYASHTDAKQAWKIRNLCLAAGLQAPKKRVKLDPNKLVGKTIGAAMEDDEYDGKIKSVVAAVFPTSELPAKVGKGSTSDDDVDEVDADDVEPGDDDDVDDLDLEEV